MEELTKAQKLVEIAKWVKSQNPEFMKNFKSMNSIIEVYKRLPSSYDNQKSVVAYIKKNLNKDCSKWDCYLTHRSAEHLSLIINSLFGFRYFADAPHRYTFKFGLSIYGRPGKEITEVKCTPIDNCSLFRTSLFERQEYGAHCITIKDLSDAKRAADELLKDVVKSLGDDYETIYGDHLREAMKKNKPSNEKLTVGIEVRF